MILNNNILKIYQILKLLVSTSMASMNIDD